MPRVLEGLKLIVKKFLIILNHIQEKKKLPEKKSSYEFRNSQPPSDLDPVKGKVVRLDTRRKDIKSQESTKENSLTPEEVIAIISDQFKKEVMRVEVLKYI